MQMQKIPPYLWFDHQAEEAAEFYTSLLNNSAITNVSRYGEPARERDAKELAAWLALASLCHRYSGSSETALDQDLRACRSPPASDRARRSPRCGSRA